MTGISGDFVLLLFTINPFAVVPVFLSPTAGMSPGARRGTALRIAAALVLLILGLRMVFGAVPGGTKQDGHEGDVTVFPLAMPRLARGGSIAVIALIAVMAIIHAVPRPALCLAVCP